MVKNAMDLHVCLDVFEVSDANIIWWGIDMFH